MFLIRLLKTLVWGYVLTFMVIAAFVFFPHLLGCGDATVGELLAVSAKGALVGLAYGIVTAPFQVSQAAKEIGEKTGMDPVRVQEAMDQLKGKDKK